MSAKIFPDPLSPPACESSSTALPFVVSRASVGDLPALLALIRQCGLLETGVAEAIEGFMVASSAGALLGSAGLEVYGEFGLLRSVAVAPSARGTGLGSSLVSGVSASARARRLRELFLLTTTAAPFFERHGFASVPRSLAPPPIAESWEFRVGCPQTAVAMRLALAEA